MNKKNHIGELMRYVVGLLLSIACSFALVAEDADKPLPKATEPVITELNAAKADATNRAIKKLQKIQGDLTKNGDLDGALAVRHYIEILQKGLNEVGSQQSKELGGAIDVVVGKWGDGTTVRWEFKADGTGNHFWEGAIYTLKWTHTDAGYSVVVLNHAPRVLQLVDKNTINVEPGTSIRMK